MPVSFRRVEVLFDLKFHVAPQTSHGPDEVFLWRIHVDYCGYL